MSLSDPKRASILRNPAHRVTIFGRPILALVFSLTMVTFSFFYFQAVDATGLQDVLIADSIGYLAGASASCMVLAWWFRWQSLLLIGLAIAAGVWLSRALLLMFIGAPGVIGANFGAMSALSWALGAILTFWVEMYGQKKVEGA